MRPGENMVVSSLSAPPEPPRLVQKYAILIVLGVVAFWAVGMPPLSPANGGPCNHLWSEIGKIGIILYAVSWTVLGVALAVIGLEGFCIRMDSEGIKKRRLRGDIKIAWREAEISRAGYVIKVVSGKRTISINPFLYSDQDQLNKFLAYHVPTFDSAL